LNAWHENAIEIGIKLKKASEEWFEGKRATAAFYHWAKQECGISRSAATHFMQIAEKFPNSEIQNIVGEGLRLLAADKTPESARKEAIERAAKGEKITEKKAKQIADKHKLPTAKAANQQAKEEGRPVLARDGFIYFGSDPEKAKEGQDRRTMVYGVRRALDTLAAIQLTALQFLTYALPHQLWTKEEEHVIKHALKWLSALDAAWDEWEDKR
jgi:hypothetical protein